MTIKSALSVVALTVAFSGAAFAQGMTINGVAVSDADLGAVQERCDQLANASTTQSLTDSTESSADSTAGGTDATITEAPAVNEAQDSTATIDLDTVTLEACTTGGFVTK
jgi:hypothetical protein